MIITCGPVFRTPLGSDAKRVHVGAFGNERVISPLENTWDSFFLDGPKASEDFMASRASQHQTTRESLE